MIKKITRSSTFIKQTKRLDKTLLNNLRNQIQKILDNPNVGKPLKYKRNERCLYLWPFRLIYSIRDSELILLKFDHRKKVYK
ncbi:MAG: type II toxin-antitoxin system RelE/ParE family toxin [Nanoarchaeota archaeon]|nr:type II toxin-antitoxin system RelE/ParE family toxin [Nanoarchaeota archaeon]